MGTTIHYSGRAKNWDALSQILRTAQLFCAQREWMFACYDDPLGVMDDHDKDNPGYLEHDGPFRGMVIRAHPKCDPIRLDFKVSNEMTPAFTKTQFAPFKVHIDVVKLLREIEPFMAELEVVDESGLWETGDEAAARAKFEFLGEAIGAFAAEQEDRGLDAEWPGVPLDGGESEEDEVPPDERPYG